MTPQSFNTFLIECVKPSPTRGQITLLDARIPTEPPIVDLCSARGRRRT